MIVIDKSKCVRCGACMRDCIVHVLTKGEDGYPAFRKEDERFCLNCQHCLAVCARGAVTCNDVGFGETLDIETIPDGLAEAALLRQRRSIRQWRDDAIPEEVWTRLVDTLAWMPTGCNDHRLHFTIVRGRFRNAPCMIVASTPKKAPCREADPWIALSYFDLLAQANGLGTCWSGFAVHAFKGMRGIRKVLNMPRGYEVGAVLLFGVPAVEYARVPHPRPMSVEVQ